MGEEYEVFIKSSVRGYHAYFVDASVSIGEVLACEREDNNAHDKYAIAVKNEAQLLVGHVPRELSKIFSRFLVDFWLTMGILNLNALVSGTTEEKGKDFRFQWTID